MNAPLFRPMTALVDCALTDENEFLETVSRISHGASAALDMVHSSTLADDSDATPLLGCQARENLILMVLATTKLLAQYADLRIEHSNGLARRLVGESNAK